jgi:peptidoglycan hydrolase-like protein with peptidoglycan-binding domain
VSSASPSTVTTRRRHPAGGHRRRRAAWRAGLAVGAAGALAVAGPALVPAEAAGLPERPVSTVGTVPAIPAGMPAAIEPLAPYVGQVSCEPSAKPGTLAFARLLTATYPGTGYLVEHPCGQDTVASEHADGRAFDWMVSSRSASGRARAEAFLGWLLATDSARRPYAAARRLGVMYVIWNDRIWSSHDPAGGWQPYSTCTAHPETAADAVCHRDRLHLSLSWAGAMARTSFWSKTVAAHDYGPCRPKDLNWAPASTGPNPKPCPVRPAVTAVSGAGPLAVSLIRFSGATLGPGSSGPVVGAVQQALKITADERYGAFTADAVGAFQVKHSLPATGCLDAATWRALLVATGARPAAVKKPAVPVVTSLTKYKKTVLAYGSRGAAVLALQKRLKVTPSGWFGPKTKSAVVAFQKKAKLRATGVVNAATWKALGA